MDKAAAGFDELGDSATAVSGDTAKAEKAIDALADAVAEAADDTQKMSDEATANANKVLILGARYEQSKEKVEQLRKELNESVEKTGAASDETLVLADQLAKAEKECAEFEKGLRDVGDALNDAGEASGGFGNSIAGGILQGNLMTDVVRGLWDGVKQLASTVWNMDEATEEYRVAQGKLNTAFQTAGYSIDTAMTTYSGFYALLGDTDTAAEASQLLAQLGTNAQDMSTWVEIATGVYGTFGDSLPIEGLIEASSETAKVGQVTGVLADALNWVGISEDDFNQKLNQCATTQERTALITNTLQQAYQSAAGTFRENNETIMAAREANLRLQDAQAQVGEETSRLKTALSTALAPTIEKVYGALEKVIGVAADAAEVFAKYSATISKPIKTDNIDEARAKVEAYKAELEKTIELMTTAGPEGVYAYSYRISELTTMIENGEAQIAEMEQSTANMTDTATAAAESIESMKISAGGVTVEMAGLNMTLEEATEILGTYTGAATNMFSQINTESELSYEQAVANMEHNIEATRAFGENMAAIAAYLPQEMADMLAAGGPEMYAGVVAMLAEANAGADPGLTQLNEKFAQGGITAGEAFVEAMAGSVPVDTETPATIVAEQMENDVSVEQAAQKVATRAGQTMRAAITTAGFDTAGQNAMQRFIAGMNQVAPSVYNQARAIAQQAASIMTSTLNSIGSYGAGRYSAGGLDYVPYNGYASVLHRGEAVLTADEADSWRRGRSSGGTGTVPTVIQNIYAVPQTPAEFADVTLAMLEQARWSM